MKKQFKHLAMIVALCASTLAIHAQQMPPIPVDKQVRIGKLDNGLTYYIRENKQPENRANFYIVQKVGSILEEESQRGLAHFLEHMAFHGSTHFPEDETGHGIISYLETIGVKFGTNLNAATGMDETIYNINDVPVNTPGALKSCLLILHDWSNALFLREKDIDKERKVIHEEWRTRRSGQMRILDSIAPIIFKDSKYAHRMPIGLMSVVDNFEPQVLRDYYHKWYRPDLQGIIIVGDIDADEVEKEIKTIFSSIPKPENPAERVYEQIPDNDEPLVAIGADKEMPSNTIYLAYKRNQIPAAAKATMDYLIYNYATHMIVQMLNDRYQEMLQKSDAPFAYAVAINGPYFGVGTKNALQVIGMPKPNGFETTISAMLREMKRARDFGFTEGEYERAKATFLSQVEKLYNERDKQQNSFYVGRYVEHFLKNEPIPSIEDTYNIYNQLVPNIPLAAINQIMQQLITDKNRVVTLMGNEKDKASFPSESKIAEIIRATDTEELAAYEDNTVKEPLLAMLPAKGSVIKEEKNSAKGTTAWTLSNGAKVIVKTTDYKKDEILVNGFALGGSSVIDNQYVAEIKLMDDVASIGGLGKFSATDLKKNLSGKNVDIHFKVGLYNESINGSSSVKDLETLMQLIYLNFTDVRKDDEAYKSMAQRLKGILATLANNPDIIFNDSLMSTVYMNNPRFAMPTVQEIDAVNYDTLLKLYKERFANPSDFTFTFVGNVSEDELKPLVEQYIASLPNRLPTREPTLREIPTRKGVCNNHFTRAMETPKATTAIIHTGKMKYDVENLVMLSALGQLFEMEFTDKIREKEGGTYGVSVRYEPEKLPKEGFTLQFQFDADPARRVALVEAMNNITAQMQQNGPDAQMLQKVKEYMLKQHTDNLKKNYYALKNTWQYYVYGVDLEKDYEKYVNELTVESVKAFAHKLLSQNNRIEVSMSSK